MERMNISISEDDRKVIERTADELGLNMSEYVRLASWLVATSGMSAALKSIADEWLGEGEHDFRAYMATLTMTVPTFVYDNGTTGKRIEYVGGFRQWEKER